MTKHIKIRVRKAPPRIRGDNSALGLFLGDSFDSLSVSGYSSLLQSPDAATGIATTASIIGAFSSIPSSDSIFAPQLLAQVATQMSSFTSKGMIL